MSAIRCKVCDRVIRGNAASEDYNAVTGKTAFVCVRCDKLMTAGMNPICRFCLIVHPPCDPEYCYCAGKLGGWNRRGEGFNAECDGYFTLHPEG